MLDRCTNKNQATNRSATTKTTIGKLKKDNYREKAKCTANNTTEKSANLVMRPKHNS
jgi:hypothetical protein